MIYRTLKPLILWPGYKITLDNGDQVTCYHTAVALENNRHIPKCSRIIQEKYAKISGLFAVLVGRISSSILIPRTDSIVSTENITTPYIYCFIRSDNLELISPLQLLAETAK